MYIFSYSILSYQRSKVTNFTAEAIIFPVSGQMDEGLRFYCINWFLSIIIIISSSFSAFSIFSAFLSLVSVAQERLQQTYFYFVHPRKYCLLSAGKDVKL